MKAPLALGILALSFVLVMLGINDHYKAVWAAIRNG